MVAAISWVLVDMFRPETKRTMVTACLAGRGDNEEAMLTPEPVVENFESSIPSKTFVLWGLVLRQNKLDSPGSLKGLGPFSNYLYLLIYWLQNSMFI